MHSLFHDLYEGNSTVLVENKWDQMELFMPQANSQ